ncbi:hypothetical protein JHK87_019068 [Glycine soja]|nr:hypothetical protein JHK87_019068 [Glycine soja]
MGPCGNWMYQLIILQQYASNLRIYILLECMHGRGMLRHMVTSFGMKLMMDHITKPFSTMETNCDHWLPNQRLYLTMAPIETQLFPLAGFRVCDDQGVGKNNIMSLVHIFDTSATRIAWKSFEPMKIIGYQSLDHVSRHNIIFPRALFKTPCASVLAMHSGFQTYV